MWQASLDTFLKYFEPCATVEESTHQFTTPQLVNMLQQHCGIELSAPDLTEYLTNKGFTYGYTQELVFEWLFKSIS